MGYANHRSAGTHQAMALGEWATETIAVAAPTRIAVMLGAQTPPFDAYVDMKDDIALAVWPGRNTSPMVKESPWVGRGRGVTPRGGGGL